MIERNVEVRAESNAPVFSWARYEHQCEAWPGKLSQHALPSLVRHKRLSEASDVWLRHMWLTQSFMSFTKKRTSYDQLQDKQFVALKSQFWLLKRELDELRAALAPLDQTHSLSGTWKTRPSWKSCEGFTSPFILNKVSSHMVRPMKLSMIQYKSFPC